MWQPKDWPKKNIFSQNLKPVPFSRSCTTLRLGAQAMSAQASVVDPEKSPNGKSTVSTFLDFSKKMISSCNSHSDM